MSEAAQPGGASAALTLGRRTSLSGLEGVLGTLPAAQLDEFLRGVTGRPWGAAPLPGPWGLRWTQDPPSSALAAILAKNPIVLDSAIATRSEELLLNGDLDHQVAGARSLQNASIPLPGVATLVSLHPVAFSVAMRAFAQRGGVPPELWRGLLPNIAARVHLNPRSWGGAWLSLMDALPVTEPTVRSALFEQEPLVTQVVVQPATVFAAYRCAVALRFDRVDQGHRAEVCATGADAWRSLATIAERARPPVAAILRVEQLRDVLTRGQGDPRVVEAVAQAAVLLPIPQARALVLQVATSHDPGVLAALIKALQENPSIARALPHTALSTLLRSPFDLPEASSLEARSSAIELARTLEIQLPQISTSVRALTQAATPDAATSPQPGVLAPPASAGIWAIETTAGTIQVALRADTAPEALAFLTEATRSGVYRQTSFHRVVPGYVAQGGDPRGDSYGGTTRIIPTEVSGGRFERGAVGLALAGLDTGGTQFFITLADSPSLDARYPYLGRVVVGMDVADRLMTGDEIVSVGLLPQPPAPSEP